MKSIILYALLFVGVIMTTSCNREWTCQCVTKEGSTMVNVEHIVIKDAKQKDAKAKCSGFEEKTEEYKTECSL